MQFFSFTDLKSSVNAGSTGTVRDREREGEEGKRERDYGTGLTSACLIYRKKELAVSMVVLTYDLHSLTNGK